ncbi:MAG: acyl carrier protein [Candidatus Rokubacteria bacterium]|nr:acyl carrier protein [Candidatus Rokubacteria bacterium]
MTPMPNDIARAVEQFVRTAFLVPDGDASFHRDAHLYDGGFVDSAGVVELIAFLESAFDMVLEDDDVFDDTFTTINGIAAVVHRRLVAHPLTRARRSVAPGAP